MKSLQILIVFLLFGINSYCQSRNTVSLAYGFATNSFAAIGIGGPGYQSNGEAYFGLNYTIRLTKVISIETGLEYSVDRVTWDYEDAYNPSFTPQKASIPLLSIPVYAKFSFFKYFFADAGFSADFQTSNKYNDIVAKQAGIGFGTGVGGEYVFKKMSVFINPFLKIHKVAPFNDEGGGQLIDLGVKLGVGYTF